jgi:hypothetical protein
VASAARPEGGETFTGPPHCKIDRPKYTEGRLRIKDFKRPRVTLI